MIEWVEPNFIVKRASVPRVRSTGFSRKLPSSNRLKAELQTPSTVIAVIDSGVDLRHRALKHHLWLNQSEKSGAGSYDDDSNGFIDDLRGWNFVADNHDVSDDLGHGAQVAGIIASQLDHQPSISILPLKALNKTGEGTVADVVEAMDYAVARRAAVINCSFGTSAFSHAMLEAIKRAETAGIVVVAAAGNRSRSIAESPFYPASYRAHQAPNLISVAATDRNHLLAGFSNFAADIAAPGESIRTAHLENSYIRLTGTSASAGFVAATAGLLKSVRGWVSAQTIRQTIIESASESFELKDKVASQGALNAAAALSLFTRNHSTVNSAPGSAKHNLALARAVAAQSSANLDTMRSSQPQAPNAYQQTGALPPASYEDPRPAITANYDAYLTQLSLKKNATGVAGSLPMQLVDPTAGTASVGGWSFNLDSGNYNFTAPVVSLPGRAGLGLSLALSYNSRVWTKYNDGNKMVFNLDRGFPAPGWQFGFGTILVNRQA
ncbi:MAG: S8 family serine peptidase, partial [Blastocatellia bacterium]